MTKRLLGKLALLTLVASALVVTVGQTAAQADATCSGSYHTESNGVLSGSQSATYAGGRSAKASISGHVRYCTRDRGSFKPDQKNQSIIIGTPDQVLSRASFVGAMVKRCVTQRISVTISHAGNIHSVTVTKIPSADLDFGSNTVSWTRKRCGTGTPQSYGQSDVVVTAPDQSGCTISTPGSAMWLYCWQMAPHIDRVTITTTATAVWAGKTREVTQTEVDTSANT